MSLIARAKKYINDKGGLWSKGGVDPLLVGLLAIIIVVGVVMLYSATYVYASSSEEYGNDPAYFFKKQISGIVFGGLCMLFIIMTNYKIYEDVAAVVGTFASFVFLVWALFLEKHNGTQRHISLGFIQIQPSDIAKFAVILTLALILDKGHKYVVSKKPLQSRFAAAVNRCFKHPVLNQSLPVIMLCGALIIAYAGLVVAGSHLSGMILISTISVAMLYFGEIRGKWFAFGLVAVIIGVIVVLNMDVLKGYMQNRIIAWRNKDFEPLKGRWQINQSLYAIASGGLLGKGFGNSTLKHNYVPEPQNDMIFAIVVEELGFILSSLLILVFALIVWRCIVIGINCPDRYGAMVAMGVAVQFGIQTILNIWVVTDFIPNTGIGLPFFSYGRTAMVMNMIEMGFVLSISRNSRIKKRM